MGMDTLIFTQENSVFKNVANKISRIFQGLPTKRTQK